MMLFLEKHFMICDNFELATYQSTFKCCVPQPQTNIFKAWPFYEKILNTNATREKGKEYVPIINTYIAKHVTAQH